jgi:thiaminase/transcriptional activator TenA
MTDRTAAGPGDAPTFEAWAAAREDPRFSDWLRARSEPEWTAATEHRFTDELAAGTLDDAVFECYLRQDYRFLLALVRLAGNAVGDAPSVAAAGNVAGFLATVTSDENDYFERAFEALGVPESAWTPDPAPVTRGLEHLLGRAGREGGYAESLAVLLPVEWVYLTWAERVEDDADAFYHSEWIALHDNPDFRAFVTGLRADLDEVGPALSPRRRERVGDLFTDAVAREVEFFETAYGAGG